MINFLLLFWGCIAISSVNGIPWPPKTPPPEITPTSAPPEIAPTSAPPKIAPTSAPPEITPSASVTLTAAPPAAATTTPMDWGTTASSNQCNLEYMLNRQRQLFGNI